jgi:hypothetical protein
VLFACHQLRTNSQKHQAFASLRAPSEFAAKDQLACEYPAWSRKVKALKIDHLLQKRHSESQSARDDFSAAVAMDKTVEPYLAWRLRSGYQSR